MFVISLLLFASGFVSCVIVSFIIFLFRKNSILKAKNTVNTMLKNTQNEIERKKRDASSELKNEIHKKRTEFDLEMKRAKIDFQQLQAKLQRKEDTIEHREVILDDLRKELQQKERDSARRLDSIANDEIKIKKLYEELVHKLEKISGIKQDEAKQVLFESLEREVRLTNRKWLVKNENEVKETAKEKSISILTTTMQRYLTDAVTLHSSSVIHLPNEEMKGRIIGKEGRNIKVLEMATGIEFVIGDTPEVITISGFNPIRREVAKRSLNKLILDGRINPTRIEETVAKCEAEVDQVIMEFGQQTILEFGFRGVNSELAKLLGKLYFRTSYTQNNLAHSKEVAYFSRSIASELGVDPELAARCGLFHDIGKAVSAEVEGPHAVIGSNLAKEYGENSTVINAIASHHEEVPPSTIYGFIVHIADVISALRPGARKETLSTYIKRLDELESLAVTFDGVKKAYALQAGREIRVIVNEDRLDDERALLLAMDLAKKIESELSYPGEIKVNVIREKRFIQAAR